MIRACAVSDLREGGAVRLNTVPPITVFHTQGAFHAIDDTCPHQEASLANGYVEDGAVECPLHGACFDLRTGVPDGPPAPGPVRTHPVVIEDGVVYVIPTTRIPPGTADPGPTESGPADPGLTESGSADPGLTESGSADPGTAEPGRSDPSRPARGGADGPG